MEDFEFQILERGRERKGGEDLDRLLRTLD